MKVSMNCPYCDKFLLQVFTIMHCLQTDHEFWITTAATDSWFVHHIETDLFIDKDGLSFNEFNRSNENIIEFDNISPQESSIKLKKIIKLKVFL